MIERGAVRELERGEQLTLNFWRGWIFVAGMSLAAAPPPAAGQARSAISAIEMLATPPDYPPADDFIWSFQQSTGLKTKLATQAILDAPDAMETLHLLVLAERRDDAAAVLERIIDRHPTDLERALSMVTSIARDARGDALHDRAGRLRELAERARTRLAVLPREAAARAARALLTLDANLSLAPHADWLRRQHEFIAEWSGTQAALLTEVDVLATGVSTQKLELLDALAHDHPSSEAGAKALYLRGFDLSVNAGAYGMLRKGEDPLANFLRVRDVVDRLEHGGYPPCEWVEKAPELLHRFYLPKGTTYSDETIRVMLATYELLAKEYFIADERRDVWSTRNLIAHRLADLYAARAGGDGRAGVEALLNAWGRDPAIGTQARYFLALYYLDLQRNGRSAEQDSSFAVQARTTLTALYNGGSSLYQRKTLATLATIEQEQGLFAAASGHLSDYIQKYPNSPWTWIAALRLGKTHEARGDWKAASAAYSEAARRYPEGVAGSLAEAYAGHAYEALGMFDDAVSRYRRALAIWDDDYGSSYSLNLTRAPRPDEPFEIVKDESKITKSSLSRQIAEFERTLNLPGGRLVARARWQFSHGQLEATLATAAELLKKYPRSPLVRDTRELSHHARLNRAMDSGNLQDLEDLEQEPYDYWISASRIARAARMWQLGDATRAEMLMMTALNDWKVHRSADMSRVAATDLEKDVVEIRNLVFRPRGDGVFAGTGWELKSLSPPDTPFFVVNPNVDVKLSTGETIQVSAHHQIPDYANVLFLDDEQLAFFDHVLARVGGTERRQPTGIMEIPNQPVGGARQVLALLERFFPARPGHWGGWMIASFPAIGAIEFMDPARTRAGVHVTVGYEGATLILEKQGGIWKFKEMTGRWIT